MELKVIKCDNCNKVLKISEVIVLNNKLLCSHCYSVVETDKQIVKYVKELESSMKKER